MGAIEDLLQRQDGVICRQQVLTCGGDDHDIRRMLRRRMWATVHRAVYVDHTGELTWRQRAWAAVLYAGPLAALDRESAIRADAGPGWRGLDERQPIRVAVAADRTVRDVPDVRVRRVTDLEVKVRWAASPPRMLVEEATLDYALSRTDDHAAFEVLAATVRARCTTAQRLLDTVEGRDRISRRRWLVAVLVDIRDGTCSVLEHGYLHKVERAHRLPASTRQLRETGPAGRTVYRDVLYEKFATVVELDGRLHDEPHQRDRDLDRDLALAALRRLTIRLGWGQVFGRPCSTAGRVAAVLQSRGWTGEPVACGPACTIDTVNAA